MPGPVQVVIALVPPLKPLSWSHNTNDDCQKSPANEGCCRLANDGMPVVEAAQGWDHELEQQ